MSLKRPFSAFTFDSDDYSSPHPGPSSSPRQCHGHDLPQKRPRHHTLLPISSSSPNTSTPPSTSSPLYYTYPTHIPPSDSPTNPFGRIRKLALFSSPSGGLALPRATSFSKHLPLRFQLVQKSANGVDDGEGGDGEGVYRIVQVPLNYTFTHLHKLIYFLFGPDHRNVDSASSRRVFSTLNTSKSIPLSAARQTKHLPVKLKRPGHLFEVHDSIRMYEDSLLPGYICSAKTWAKLSSVLDPLRFSLGYNTNGGFDGDIDADLGEDEEDEEREGEGDVNGEDGEEDCIWEAEEDFTLGHVWPEGGDLKRGVTYVRSSFSYPTPFLFPYFLSIFSPFPFFYSRSNTRIE